MAAKVPTQIRVDSYVKEQATELFSNLGLDMSGAVNIFLHQCILQGGLPFSVELPKYNDETIAAMLEARKLARDPKAKRYDNMDDLIEALEAD